MLIKGKGLEGGSTRKLFIDRFAEHGIGLASVIQREPGKLGSAEVVLFTYAAPESALAAAEAELAKLSTTRAVRARIRVEGK